MLNCWTDQCVNDLMVLLLKTEVANNVTCLLSVKGQLSFTLIIRILEEGLLQDAASLVSEFSPLRSSLSVWISELYLAIRLWISELTVSKNELFRFCLSLFSLHLQPLLFPLLHSLLLLCVVFSSVLSFNHVFLSLSLSFHLCPHLSFISLSVVLLGSFTRCSSPPCLVPLFFSWLLSFRIICSALFWTLTGCRLLLCR